MRVAWVHPTWRDLVIERLADDAARRHRFLAHCGPHGLALAFSVSGGDAGERQLPLIRDDEDWDAIGDRIYAMAPELEQREAAIVLLALHGFLQAVRDDALLAGEGAALARMAVERFGELWESAHTAVSLPCIDGWLSVAGCLNPKPWPTFLSLTWAELLPTTLPAADDLEEMQRFTDWRTLCEAVAAFSPLLLEQLGYDSAQRRLMRAFRDRGDAEAFRQERAGASLVPEWEFERSRTQGITDSTVRRVLGDL